MQNSIIFPQWFFCKHQFLFYIIQDVNLKFFACGAMSTDVFWVSNFVKTSNLLIYSSTNALIGNKHGNVYHSYERFS